MDVQHFALDLLQKSANIISMIPLFKSNFSIGKSILTMDEPKNDLGESSDSIIEIALSNNLDKIVLIEDSMIGFLESHKICKINNIQLIYGLRINCCNLTEDEDKEKSKHKIIIFAKNDQGCKLLNKIYSNAYCNHNGFVDSKYLSSIWNVDHLELAIPFYDSYIYNNNFTFSSCVPDFTFCKPNYFIENNNLPLDEYLTSLVKRICNTPILTKSIYYKSKKDVYAFQTYKILCNRSFGKESSLSNPNLNNFASDEFCWESYLEYGRSA